MNMFRPLLLSLLALTSASASADSVVVFNEVMYHPPGDGLDEWVELHNQMSVDIDLSRWTLAGGIDFAFPEGTIIPGGGYLVVAAQPEEMENALGPFSRRLANDGETLELRSASGRLMNVLSYRDGGDWPLEADGSGASLAKVRRDGAAGNPVEWSWSAELGGSPGQPNFAGDTAPPRPLRINEVAGAGEDFWVELVNAGSQALALDGYVLRQEGREDAIALPAGTTLEPGAFWLLESGAFPEGVEDGVRLWLLNADETSLLDAVEVRKTPRGRFPDGAPTWVRLDDVSPGNANSLQLEEDVVINEIFYHHRPRYAQGEIPYAEVDDEWIELFHRGQAPLDLSEWELDGDISYTFAPGTTLSPGTYLVIRNDENGFKGGLSNSGGHIALQDAAGRVVDEVRYFDNGDWPEQPDGGGSSLELRDPRADNGNPLAWAASDESARTEWQEISYRGVAQSSAVGPDNQWSEFVLGLLDDGEVLLDDIRVTEDPDGRKLPLINNSSFQSSIFGGGPLRGWRLLGNHRHGEVVPDPDDPGNTVLRLRATGPTEHMHNHVEITLGGGARITNGTVYEISYRARPVSGSPQVNTRLYFNRLPQTTILKTPDVAGTPGAANSRLETNIGPTLSTLSHTPVIPSPQDSPRVTIRAQDPDGVDSLTLFWAANGGEFASLPMTPQDTTTFSASLPPQDTDSVVQFYVEASDLQGAISRYPAEGPESRALYQVANPSRLGVTALNHLRIIMAPQDAEWLHDEVNLMSNGRVPATVIYKEKEIFYNVGIRLKGSERGRVTVPRLGFNVQFPSQQPFRGVHQTVAIDRSEGVNFGQFEMLFNQMMTHSGGVPAEYNDLIHVITPQDRHTGPAELQLARYGDIFLDSQFDDGSEGNLYEYELIYYPTTANAEGYKRPQPDSVVGTAVRDLGDNPEEYRWVYQLKNNRKRDAFSPIMAYAKLFSLNNDAFLEALPEMVDVEGWLKGMAQALLTGAGDQYGANSQHNGMFYQRPDGKFIYFPHDLDFAFSASRSITENNDLKKILRHPGYERMYLAYVNDLITTTFNENYMTRWATHFGELLPNQNFNSHLSYVVERSKNVKSQINRAAPQTTFGIQTEGGQDFQTDQATVELRGTGGLNLHRLVHVETGDVYKPEWIDLVTWKIDLPLQPGSNVFTLQGIDVLGGTGSIFAPVGNGKITITSTAPPVDAISFEALQIALESEDTIRLLFQQARPGGAPVAVEISDDLRTWVEVDEVTTTTETLSETREAVTVRFAIEPGTSGFVRLKREQP